MKLYALLLFTIILFASCGQSPTKKEDTKEEIEHQGLYHPEWTKNATIYEVNVRQHTPEGTFNALISDLVRLDEMGVKILWLMPVHPIGEVNRKGGEGSYYSVQDYRAINPKFGTMEDFQRLVSEAHDLDMKVIIDWVANHSSFDNVWTVDHLDWYNLDSLGGLQPPAGTDWWDVADFNYDNPKMRQGMIDAMSFWVEEANIDGFRCDVASYVPTDFWNQAADSLRAINKDIFLLAEAENPELHAEAFNAGYAWEWLHIINGIPTGDKTLDDIDAYMAKTDTALPNGAYKMYFTTNHDENSWNGTVFDRFGEGHLAYATITFTIDGMPLVYSGQEAGMDYALEFFEKDTIEWGEIEYGDFYTSLMQLN
ncbi:MAG TPA: alpha-amylase family glycosyl hydrolase, partial [Cryomorphaceae bacterium]|nr:alpha-amylase family glycosyl hydrolase [Cryomorphaceae bacterium]